MEKVKRYIVPIGIAIIFGILVSIPQCIHMMDERFAGIPVHLNSDEHTYLARVQDTLLGNIGEGSEGMTKESRNQPPFQVALLEESYGIAFGWTNLSAAWLLQVMDFVMPALVFLGVFWLFIQTGLSRKQALFGASIFCALELYNLGRPIHQRASFFLLCLCLVHVWKGCIGNMRHSIIGGVYMGILFGVYLWSWTAAWCIWLVLLVLFALKKDVKSIKKLAISGGIGAVVATPFVVHMVRIQSHLAYNDVGERAGLIHWRLPESWPWSIAFFLMATSIFAWWWRDNKPQAEVLFVALVVSAFGLLNQHVIHGTLILFRSHYLFLLVCVAVLTLCKFAQSWRVSVCKKIAVVSAMAICAAMLYEDRYVIQQWIPSDAAFAEQHLASSLPVLQNIDRSVIISDEQASQFISSHTKHDVAYNVYLVNNLTTYQELTERYCLSKTALPTQDRHTDHALITQYNLQRDALVRLALLDKQQQLIRNICTKVDANPNMYLQKYQVTHMLWDEKRQPNWQVDQLGAWRKMHQGNGWSIWKIEI